MRNFIRPNDPFTGHVETVSKWKNEYLVDVTTYVPSKARCKAIEMASENLAKYRAEDSLLYDVHSVIGKDGKEVFDQSSVDVANNGRYGQDLFIDKLDAIDKLNERVNIIESEVNTQVNGNLARESELIRDVAEAKADNARFNALLKASSTNNSK